MAGVGRIPTTCWTEIVQPPTEAVLAELARCQHGVVALRQLTELGMSPSAVRSRAAAGRLHRVHRGVYAVGHPLLSTEGRWMAAALACGPEAVLSHRSAAELWGLHSSARAAIDVTVPRRGGRSRPGIDMHRAQRLPAVDVTEVSGIPCTTVARTLVDLAEVVPRRQVERAFDQGEVLRIVDRRAIDDVLARAAGRRGAAVVRGVLADHAPGTILTRGELEERFLRLCGSAGVPRPEVNAWIALDHGATVQADFLWRDRRLIVETDGRATHGTRRAFEWDRRRDRMLTLAGWRVVRCTWRDVTREPGDLMRTVRALLAA